MRIVAKSKESKETELQPASWVPLEDNIITGFIAPWYC